jgi:hypothetical protein
MCKRVVYVTECREKSRIQVLPEYDKGNRTYLFLEPRRSIAKILNPERAAPIPIT